MLDDAATVSVTRSTRSTHSHQVAVVYCHLFVTLVAIVIDGFPEHPFKDQFFQFGVLGVYLVNPGLGVLMKEHEVHHYCCVLRQLL